MFGFGQSAKTAEGKPRANPVSWFAAVAFTLVMVGSIFYLVASASGARLDRILDQGAYSDLQRIGREIDRRANNLTALYSPERIGQPPDPETFTIEPVPGSILGNVAAETGDEPASPEVESGALGQQLEELCDPDDPLCSNGSEQETTGTESDPEGTDVATATRPTTNSQQEESGQSDTGSLEESLRTPIIQTCRYRGPVPEGFDPEFASICERDPSQGRGNLALRYRDCDKDNKECKFQLETKEQQSLSLETLGLERVNHYAIYNDVGKIAAQIDGQSLMPARLPIDSLQRLASEASITDLKRAAGTSQEDRNSNETSTDETTSLDPDIMRETTIAGQKFRVYALRLDNSRAMMVGSEPCGQRACYIVGLAPVRGLWDDLTSLSPLTQLVFVSIIGILILSIPILKLATIGGSAAFGKVDVAMLALSIPLAAATATLVIAAYANWHQIARNATQTTITAATKIDASLTETAEHLRKRQYDLLASQTEGQSSPLVLVKQGGESDQLPKVYYNDTGLMPPPAMAKRDYVAALLEDTPLWPCKVALPSSEGDAAKNQLKLGIGIGGEQYDVLFARSGLAADGAIGKSGVCEQIVSRQRSLPRGALVAGGSKSTIVGVPVYLKKREPADNRPADATVSGETSPAESTAEAASEPATQVEAKPERAALINTIIDGSQRAANSELAMATEGFGYAVIDSRNSQVLHHQKPRREFVEFFSQEVDQYRGGWLDQLAQSMKVQCRIGQGAMDITEPRQMYYEGRLLNAVAKPNCQTGWIVVTWWDDARLQYQATDASVLAAGIYLSFAFVFLVAIFVAIYLGWFDPRSLWPNADAPQAEVERAKVLIFETVFWLVIGGALFAASVLVGGGALLSNLIIWIAIGIVWAGFRRRTRGKTSETRQDANQARTKFEAHTNFRFWLTGWQFTLVFSLAIAPMVCAYVAADNYRDSLRDWVDSGVFAQALKANPQPKHVILNKGVISRTKWEEDKLERAQREGAEPATEALAQATLAKGPTSLLAAPLMPRITLRAYLNQTVEQVPLKLVDRIEEERLGLTILPYVGLVFLSALLIGVICYVLIAVQRALLGLHHVQLPTRDTDADIIEFIKISREGGTRKFLIIDCDDNPRTSLEENRQKAQEIVRLDLALERHTLEHLEAPNFGRRIWFITNVDVVLSDPDIRDRGLRLLEMLASRPEAEVYLFSEIPPLVRLRTEWEALVRRMELMGDDTKAAGEMLHDFELEQSRWSRLLGDFQTIYCSSPYAVDAPANDPNRIEILDSDCDQVKRVKQEANNIRYREAKEQLRRLAEEKDRLCKWTEAEVTTRIQAEMAEYYERQWRICSRAEQLALLQLAEGRFLNNANVTVLSQLMQRGLVVRDPEFRIMNKSFAKWVLSTEKGRSFDRFRERAESDGAWRLLRLPLLIAVVGSVSLLGYLNQENIEFMVALFPALLSGVPILISTLFGGKAPEAR